ncbi:hypothetical protein [uncultured Treponema sp.]|uniref:hypothetical protein n=1 Tax=uncultured Treponema sp. TaxID=162155 RepID=UPI0025FFD62E|nr:hypothetical protein [uncultured Treponema sp.]
MEDRNKIEEKILALIFGKKDDSGNRQKNGLVSVRKKADYKNLAEYQRLQMRIPHLIWKYAEILFPHGISVAQKGSKGIICRLCDSGLEINEFLRDFVETFEPDTSRNEEYVLHYITKVLRQKIRTAGIRKVNEDRRQGIRLTDNKNDDSHDKAFADLAKICDKYGKNIREKNTAEWLSAQTGKKIEKIKYLIDSHSFTFEANEVKNKDGDICSLFDLVSEEKLEPISQNLSQEKIKSGEEERRNRFKSLLEPILEKYDAHYKATRSDTKKGGFLSAVMTNSILAKFDDLTSLRSFTCELISRCEFAREKVCLTMLEEWKNGKQVISQKGLAEKFGRDPSKVSKAAAGLKEIWKEK